MPFNPLQSLLAGQQGRLQFDKNQARQALAQAAQQPGFNQAFSPEAQQVAAFSSDPLSEFKGLTKDRKQAYFDDSSTGLELAKSGKWAEVMDLAKDRKVMIQKLRGNTNDVDSIIQAVESQDFEGATALLQSGVDAGVRNGFLKDDELRKKKLRTKDNRTANSKDWAEFQRLVQKAEQTGDPEDRKSAIQFGRGSGFIKPTEQESADIKVTAAERKAMLLASVKRKQGFIDTGITAADSMANIRRSLDLLDTVKTGGWDNVKLKAMQLFGVEGANEAELSANMGRSVLAQLKPIFGGAFTKEEVNKLERLEAKFGSNTTTNIRLLNQVMKMANRAARRGLSAAEDQKEKFAAQEIRDALAFKLDDKDFISEPIPKAGGNKKQSFNFDAQGNLIQ